MRTLAQTANTATQPQRRPPMRTAAAPGHRGQPPADGLELDQAREAAVVVLDDGGRRCAR